MAGLIEFVTGLRRAGVGVQQDAAGGPFGELIVNEVGLGRYFNLVARGLVYTTMIKAVTVAATHNTPISANTATPVCALGSRRSRAHLLAGRECLISRPTRR
jgi:hypothetical protein